MERAKQILTVLELTDWKWTILDVLEQPEAELNLVFSLKALGEKVRIYRQREKDPDAERI